MVTPLAVVYALGGFLLGLAADRLATRWPQHDDAERPSGRRFGWRTVVTTGTGAVALGILPQRFGGDPVALGLFTAWVGTLVVGLATDLDQRRLPDALTLPVVPMALGYAISGLNPLVGDGLPTALVGALVIPVGLYLPSRLFGSGAFGLGDVKLLVGIGLMLGFGRAFVGITSGLIVAGVVLLMLLAAGRIRRTSYVPFGPFLIVGALFGIVR